MLWHFLGGVEENQDLMSSGSWKGKTKKMRENMVGLEAW
jgi:hypothetical protein